MSWRNCLRIRTQEDRERSEKMDHIWRLLARNDRRQADRECNQAWDEYETREVVSGRRRQRR